ncbi:MAG: hypothetical protein ACRCVN_07485 [Spirochaetia bacterium]
MKKFAMLMMFLPTLLFAKDWKQKVEETCQENGWEVLFEEEATSGATLVYIVISMKHEDEALKWVAQLKKKIEPIFENSTEISLLFSLPGVKELETGGWAFVVGFAVA